MGRRNIQMRALYVSDNYKQVLTAVIFCIVINKANIKTVHRESGDVCLTHVTMY